MASHSSILAVGRSDYGAVDTGKVYDYRSFCGPRVVVNIMVHYRLSSSDIEYHFEFGDLTVSPDNADSPVKGAD